jgi:FkbM family methyltransferase
MNDALLAPRRFVSLERLLWLGGRFFHLIPADTPIRVPFGINRGRLWVRGSANAPEWLGIYEYGKQRLLRHLVREGSVVCDIGANAGFYTLALSALVGPRGRVVSFEPMPVNVNKLRRHLKINQISNVLVTACALSDRSGVVGFAPGESDFTGRISGNTRGALPVPTITLDEFLSQQGLADPSFLKIDVEGAEARVLEGAQKCIERGRPAMLVAIHGREAAQQCHALLCGWGYVVRTPGGVKIENAAEMPDEIVAISQIDPPQ